MNTIYYVTAVRVWDEKSMTNRFPNATEVGSEKSFVTRNYKTLRGLIRYGIQDRDDYYGHVWAIWRVMSYGPDVFVGLEYNHADEGLRDLAARYLRAKARNEKDRKRTTGYPLSARM